MQDDYGKLTGVQSGLRDAQEEPSRQQACVVLAKAHECHAQTPREHDGREEVAWRKALEQDVGDGLGKSVRDEEDLLLSKPVVLLMSTTKAYRETVVVSVVVLVHAKVFFKADKTRIANVLSVGQ